MNTIRSIFEKAVRSKLIYLERQDYQLQDIENQKVSESSGPAVMATLKNNKVDRIVTIHYFQSGFLSATIRPINPPEFEWDDYTSTGSMMVYSSNINTIPGTLEEQLNTFLEEINKTLKKKFRKVIRGQYFQSDQLDWGGQK